MLVSNCSSCRRENEKTANPLGSSLCRNEGWEAERVAQDAPSAGLGVADGWRSGQDCEGEEGNRPDVQAGRQVQLHMRAREQAPLAAGQGAWCTYDPTIRGEHIPDDRLQCDELPARASGEDLEGGARGKGLGVPEDVGDEHHIVARYGSRPCYEVVTLHLRGVNESIQGEDAAGDPRRGQVDARLRNLAPSAGVRTRAGVREHHVCAINRPGGVALAEGWTASRGVRSERGGRGASPRNFEGHQAAGRAGPATFSCLVASAWGRDEGSGDGGHTIKPSALRRMETISCPAEAPEVEGCSAVYDGELRDRRDRRGAQGGRQGEETLPGTLGGIQSSLGGAQDQWSTGRPNRNMGAAVCAATHGCAGGVEGAGAESPAPYVLALPATPTETQRKVRKERCDKQKCLTVRAELRNAVTELQHVRNELQRERDARSSYIDGEIRAKFESDYAELKNQMDATRRVYDRMKASNKQYLSKAKELRCERATLLEEIAQLKGELHTTKEQLAREARAAVVEARKSAVTIKRLEHALKVADMEALKRVEKAEKKADTTAREAEERAEQLIRQAEKEATLAKARADQMAAHHERRAEKALTTAEVEVQNAKAAADQRSAFADAQVRMSERRAADAEELAEAAKVEACEARREAMEEAEAARDAASEKDLAQYQLMLQQRQTLRAKEKAERLQERLKQVAPLAAGRTADEWSELRNGALRKAAQRERDSLRSFFTSHSWRAVDVASVLMELEMLPQLFDTKEGWSIYFSRVKKMHAKLETEDFGIRFGLFLHFELKLTLPKIQQMVEAACKEFHSERDRYSKKDWLSNPYNKKETLKTPRIVPSRTKLEPVIKQIASQLGVASSENGKLAFISFDTVVQQLLSRDAGKLRMPPKADFLSGLRLPIVISRDATGKGSLQFTTVAARSPWASKSAQQLHIFGFGCCGDDRSGTERLLGPNLQIINEIVEAAERNQCVDVDVDGETHKIFVDPYFTDDVSALRHGEHLANSGWCGCGRDAALRQVPAKPTTIAEMLALVSGSGRCRELSCLEREILSHNPVKGESLPRPCIAPGCKFAHNRTTAAAEYKALLDTEEALAADTSKKGKVAFSAFRMEHAWKGNTPHFNVQPGMYGRPLFRHHFRKQILDSLHLVLLGLPKIPWKHGIKNNASDDAREQISEQLKQWGYPLDMRRKEDGCVRESKWFTGEKWQSFIAGKGKSPGGPIAIATIVMIIADDLQLRGVDHGSGLPDPPAVAMATGERGAVRAGTAASGSRMPGGRGAGGRGGSRSKAAFARRMHARAAQPQAHGAENSSDELESEELGSDPKVTYVPTEFEKAAKQESLAIIRRLYGSRAPTLINALLSFDAYFTWYFAFKSSVPYLCDTGRREQRAFDNICKAIDMQDMFERVSIQNHKSFLPHGAVFKVTRDILEIADTEAHDLSALELQNAESKRVYETGGARHLTFSSSGATRKKAAGQDEHRIVTTKGYGASAATSVLTKLLATKLLRVGDGMYSTPASRRSERLFGETSAGRSKLIKLEVVDGETPDYQPSKDACLDAFVRLLADRASAESL